MEQRLYDPKNPPPWLDPAWWRDRAHCNHLESETGAHRARLHAAAAAVDQLFGASPIDECWIVVDLGAGDGGLLSLLEPDMTRIGYEIINNDVIHAQRARGLDVRPLNVLTEDWHADATDGYRHPHIIAVATEFLEHQADPHGFLRDLAGKADYVVASSPWGETAEQHEWNHAWAWDEVGYLALFEENGWKPVSHERVEWSQLLVAKPIGADPDGVLTTEEAVAALEDEREGIVDLDPYVKRLLAVGREAGLP